MDAVRVQWCARAAAVAATTVKGETNRQNEIARRGNHFVWDGIVDQPPLMGLHQASHVAVATDEEAIGVYLVTSANSHKSRDGDGCACDTRRMKCRGCRNQLTPCR